MDIRDPSGSLHSNIKRSGCVSAWHPSFHVLRLFPSRWLTRCSHSCRFPSNPAVLSCCHSSELEPSVKGDSPLACFYREQHLDRQTSDQRLPVWGQEDQNENRSLSIFKNNIPVHGNSGWQQIPCFTWDNMVNLHHYNVLYIDIVSGLSFFT